MTKQLFVWAFALGLGWVQPALAQAPAEPTASPGPEPATPETATEPAPTEAAPSRLRPALASAMPSELPPPPEPAASERTPAASPERGVGFALELGMGPAAGTMQGEILAGLHLGSAVLGLTFDLQDESRGTYGGSTHVAIGAGARLPLGRTADGKLECILALDAGIAFTSYPRDRSDHSASGPVLGIGPGLRYWLHPQFAIGWITEVQHRALDGEFPVTDVNGYEDFEDGERSTTTLASLFHVLAAF